MIKVLIIEDEILARIGLRQLLDWNRLGFELLPDAKDGEEALKAIREQKPEILLLDLNIPKMNGLQILERLKAERAECRAVVISCHEEFEMVKEAMKLGAYDYLRKLNLCAEELQGILKKCQMEMERGRDERLPRFDIRNIRYEEILNGSGKDIFLNVGTYRSLLCILTQCCREDIYAAADFCRSWVESQGQECLEIRKGDRCCYFLFDSRFAGEFYEALHGALVKRFGGRVYLGIHEGVMKDVEDVNHALVLAEQISTIGYYDEEREIVRFEDRLETEGHGPSELHVRLDALKLCVKEFRRTEAEQEIREIFHVIRERRYVSVNVLRRIFMDMLGVYSMTAQGLGGAVEEISVRGDNCHYQRLMFMSSLREIEGWFWEFTGRFCDHFLVRYKCSRSELLKSAFAYIETHLTAQIHLSEAAREIGVSGAYLSTVFKKEMGQNFIEYVNLRKVEMAKRMLEEGRMVHEVSDTLGFENCTYFSRVFKRYADLSPEAYRKGAG